MDEQSPAVELAARRQAETASCEAEAVGASHHAAQLVKSWMRDLSFVKNQRRGNGEQRAPFLPDVVTLEPALTAQACSHLRAIEAEMISRRLTKASLLHPRHQTLVEVSPADPDHRHQE
jgi:hypothetical protein